jgi:tRNA-specific adenosine deaminase 3
MTAEGADNDVSKRGIENLSANGRLVQIKAPEDHRELELLDVWTTVIPAQTSNALLCKLREQLPEEKHALNHIRRLVKEKEQDSVIYLRVVVCSVDCVPEKDRIEAVVRSPVEKRQVSKYQAYTKEQAAEWSQKSWPIMWRGNPAAIPTELTAGEQEQILKNLQTLAELSNSHDASELPIATLIVDPTSDKVLISKLDSRAEAGNPLQHSVMQAIHAAAELEAERRLRSSTPTSMSESTDSLNSALEENNYLCLNLDVYTTHEPCAMCAMALVHSRIGRLVYVNSSPLSGAIEPTSGAGYSVHWNKQLNWTYQAWKWRSHGYEPSAEDLLISSVEPISPRINA